MDNQHREISGYRDLTRIEVDLMNQAKNMGGTLGAFIEALEKVEAVDKRWLAVAKADLQKGLMSLVRSIAKPTTF